MCVGGKVPANWFTPEQRAELLKYAPKPVAGGSDSTPIVTPATTPVPCAGGSHIKPTIIEDQKWLTAADLCASVSWWKTWFGGFCDQLVPTLIDLSTMCARVPNPPPDIDLDAMAKDGTLFRLPNLLADWLGAWWENTNWNTFCECIGGTGCGSTVFDVTLTAGAFGQQDSITRYDITPGITTLTMTYSFTNPGSTFMQYTIVYYKADGTVLTTTAITTSNHAETKTGTFVQASMQPTYATAVKYGLRATNLSSGGPYTVRMQGQSTYTGCANPTLPFVPPTEDPKPDTPDIPTAPTDCTTADLCRIVNEVTQLVTINQTTINQLPPAPAIKWKPSTAHTGLREFGSVVISPATIGVQVVLESAPVPAKLLDGEPEFWWNMGFITPKSGTKPLRGWRLVFDHQAFELPRFADGVSYTLLDDTQVTLIELIPDTS